MNSLKIHMSIIANQNSLTSLGNELVIAGTLVQHARPSTIMLLQWHVALVLAGQYNKVEFFLQVIFLP